MKYDESNHVVVVSGNSGSSGKGATPQASPVTAVTASAPLASSGGQNPGPNVYLDSTAMNTYSETGPHQRWAVGTLYDSLVVSGAGAAMNVRNALWEGSGHGWQGANHVFWNGEAPSMECQRPPTVHQWNVGGISPKKTGYCEWIGFGAHVMPPSLYRAQLSDRLSPAAEQAIARRM